MVKQTLESVNQGQTILLNGNYVHLGKFENIVRGQVEDREVSFLCEVKIDREDINTPENFAVNMAISDESSEKDPEGHSIINASVLWVCRSDSKFVSDNYIRPIIVERLELCMTSGSSPVIHKVQLIRVDGKEYSLKWENISIRLFRGGKNKEI